MGQSFPPSVFSIQSLGVFTLSGEKLDGMLAHCRVTPSIALAGIHLYTWVERGTEWVKCLVQEQNTMTLARYWTKAAQSGVEHNNHEVSPPLFQFPWQAVDEVYLQLMKDIAKVVTQQIKGDKVDSPFRHMQFIPNLEVSSLAKSNILQNKNNK